MDRIDRTELVAACRTTYALASTPEVTEGWESESACAGMTVGGLSHHVLGQVRIIVGLLSQPPTADPPIPVLDHYARAAWVTADPDDEANTSIRDGSDAAATVGPAAVLAEIVPLLERLPEILSISREPDTVFIPWQSWVLTTDDFLATRAMELVVHSDDLAASVGLSTPDFPDSVVERVVGLLAGVAIRRHGQTAVVRALSRPQRAPGTVSAF